METKYHNSDYFKYYRETVPKELKKNVTRDIHSKVLQDFNECLAESMIDSNKVVVPCRLGSFYLRRKKMDYDRLSVDWGEYNRSGKIYYHLNDHTDGHKVVPTWVRSIFTRNKSKKFYFKLSKANNRKLGDKLMNIEGYYKRFLT